VILAGGRASRFGGRNKSALTFGGTSILERQVSELARVVEDIMLVGGPHAPPGVPPQSEMSVRFVADRTRGCGPLAETADAAVPRTERGYHPPCAAYTRACRRPVAGHLAAGHLRMSDLLGVIRVHEVTSDDIRAFGHPDRLLANINTEAEYAGLHLASKQKL
jgi:molybdopterin-guanine dinucleotide biosynthesis protein A